MLKIAIVTPYFKETPRVLARCIDSVRTQQSSAHVGEITHFVVADGHPQHWIDDLGLRHVKLDRSHGDYGNTPRSIGAQLAASDGHDAIGFLDADNWLDPDHVACCADALMRAAEPVDYVVARRRLVRDDGSALPIAPREDETFEHVDTSCYFLSWSAFHLLGRWSVMPKPLSIVGDRIFRQALREAGLKFTAVDHPTVNYLCTWSTFFDAIGETPPEYAKPNIDLGPVTRWWQRLDARSRSVVERLTGCPVRL